MFEEFTFSSSNGVYNIHSVRWIPDGQIKGIVQISHGMCEHIERYNDFALFLNSKGLLVTGNDHIGHGRSVKSDDDLGCFSHKNGGQCVVEDVHTLTAITKKLYPDAAYVLLGHSMGSFITANYIETYGDELDAAVLVGTGYNSGLKCISGRIANGAVAKIKGEQYRSELMAKLLMGSYNNRIDDRKTEFDWLSRDEKTVERYMDDPYCGFTFAADANRALISFAQYENKHFDDIPKDLPILLASGKCDPVGNYGKGVKKIFDLLKKCGINDVALKLYDGMRHEILNEIGNEQVYEDIYDWISGKIN